MVHNRVDLRNLTDVLALDWWNNLAYFLFARWLLKKVFLMIGVSLCAKQLMLLNKIWDFKAVKTNVRFSSHPLIRLISRVFTFTFFLLELLSSLYYLIGSLICCCWLSRFWLWVTRNLWLLYLIGRRFFAFLLVLLLIC